MINSSDVSTKARAFIYARASLGGQVEVQSMLEQQEQAARDKCDEHGFEIAGIFIDAENFDDDRERPEFNRMVTLACSDEHLIDYVIATDMTRIARNHEAGMVARDLLIASGVHLLLIDEEGSISRKDVGTLKLAHLVAED